MEPAIPFILIDDSEIDNFIHQRLINTNVPQAAIRAFTNADEGLQHIRSEFAKPDAPDAILFLDLIMPINSGWDFMENFDKLDTKIKQLFKIYVLSSSKDSRDVERAHANNYIIEYIIKPLTDKKIVSIVTEYPLKSP